MKARYIRIGLVFGVLMLYFSPLAKGEIGLPFGAGETWTVCQGYNGEISHAEKPMLDLSVNPASPGSSGCTNGLYSSTGRIVISPWKGVVSPFGRTDMICITNEGGTRSMAIGHLVPDSKREVGKIIAVGDPLGIVDGPNTKPTAKNGNGNYAHIHLQLYDGGKCLGNFIPFTGDMRFQYHDDLFCDTFEEGKCTGSPNQHSGVKLSNPAASTWHPNGTLIRAAGDDKVYYLKRDGTTGKLKRRHIVNETVFTNSGYNWNEVVVVSPQERDCFDEGAKVTAPESDLLKTRLVIPEGDYKVYVISENNLHWLNLTPEEFVSMGYQWGNVGTLHANHNIPYGTSLAMQDFRMCERDRQSSPPPAPTLKPNGALCSIREECSSNWCQAIPNGTKYCMDVSKSCAVPGS